MKHNNLFKLAIAILSFVFVLGFVSCKPENVGGDDKLSNQFSFNGDKSEIKSVAWLYDEARQVYSVYLSPTEGIEDYDSMIDANDYILINTSVIDGEADLVSGNNSLVYGQYMISSENASSVAESYLKISLSDNSSMKVSLKTKMTGGEYLNAEYDGKSVSVVAEDVSDVVLDRNLIGVYMGTDAGVSNYYLVMSDAEAVINGKKFTLQEEGFALQLDIYSPESDIWTDIPEGEYAASSLVGEFTYSEKYSGVVSRDADGNVSDLMPLAGPVSVKKSESGYIIETTYTTATGKTRSISFSGALEMSNETFNPSLPLIGEDVEVKGFYAEAFYQGNAMQSSTGLMQINFYDEKWENREIGGMAMTVVVFHDLFKDSKKSKIMPGDYYPSSDYSHSSWMRTEELDLMGVIIPIGTYVMLDDGTDYGCYSYAESGKVTITEVDNGIQIECDLVSADGYVIKGSFSGFIGITDASDDNEDDGSSTLERDLDMELDYLPKAYCFPNDMIWTKGLGTIPVVDIPTCYPPGQECAYQSIDIGLETGFYDEEGILVEGDIIRLDLLVNPGQEDKITVGTYPVTASRYPVDYRPGVAPRGYQGADGNLGTRWEKIVNVIGNGDVDGDGEVEINVPLNIPTVGGYACVYSGEITISKADGGENWFTFDINGFDVVGHKIAGQWTGPVYMYGSGAPVLPSEDNFEIQRLSPISQALGMPRK